MGGPAIGELCQMGRLSKVHVVLGISTILLLALIAIGGIWYSRASVRWEQRRLAEKVTGGNAELGEAMLDRYGCGACHVLPGGSDRPGPATGPPLINLSERVTLAGGLENRADNLVRWIVNPQSIDPDTTMPAVGVSTEDARHIAAHLYATVY